MGFIIKYKNIVELSLWHHHWLDTATHTFAPPPSGATPPAIVDRLLEYDLRRLLRLRLSPASEKTVRSKGLIFRPTGTGCLLASKDGFTETDPTAKITLLVSAADPLLLQYSDFGFTKFENKILYLSNFDTPPPGLKTAAGTATTALRATAPADRAIWSPGIVRLPKLNPADGNAMVQVFDLNSNPVQQVLETEVKSQPGQTEYELDGRALREGLYRFDSPALAANTVRFVGLENEGGLLAVTDIFLLNLSDEHYHVQIDKI